MAFSENSQYTSESKVASVSCSSHEGSWKVNPDDPDVAKFEKYLLQHKSRLSIHANGPATNRAQIEHDYNGVGGTAVSSTVIRSRSHSAGPVEIPVLNVFVTPIKSNHVTGRVHRRPAFS